MNLSDLNGHQHMALADLVHEEASTHASNAINAGEAVGFLLANGWTEDDIHRRLADPPGEQDG